MTALDGKVALISGGAGGLGMAATELLIEQGASVAIADVDNDSGRKWASGFGEAAIFVHLDVTLSGDWKRATQETVDQFGSLDILVNAAGILRVAPMTTMSEDDYMDVVRVNQLGTFLGMQAVVPHMTAGGSIVNISSVAGMKGTPGVIGYVASKWAVRGMTKAAALELGKLGIRVNSVHPGTIDTPMVQAPGFASIDRDKLFAALPVPRIGQPADVAEMIAFLASDASAYCTGSEFVVDGGGLAGTSYDVP